MVNVFERLYDTVKSNISTRDEDDIFAILFSVDSNGEYEYNRRG